MVMKLHEEESFYALIGSAEMLLNATTENEARSGANALRASLVMANAVIGESLKENEPQTKQQNREKASVVVNIETLEEKYALAISVAEKEYNDTEGDLTRAVIAALESDRIDDLPTVDQIEILAWNLYLEWCVGEEITRPNGLLPCNWEHVQKSTWVNIARRAIHMMEFAR